jgi:hypothetical protein
VRLTEGFDMSSVTNRNSSFGSLTFQLLVWFIGTVAFAVILWHYAPTALCDGSIDVAVTTSRPIPAGVRIDVAPFRSGRLKGSTWQEIWLASFDDNQRLNDEPAIVNVPLSYRSRLGYSYNYFQLQDSLLVRWQRNDDDPEWTVVPIPHRPKKRSVSIVIPIPGE